MSTHSERAVISHRDVVELQPWTAPEPAPDQVRIRVSHSAVSFGDVMLRRHVFRPRPRVAVTGYEIVGTVDAVGSAVSTVRPGERVAAFVEYGGHARHAFAPARDLVAVPDGVPDDIAAALVLNYATAIGMLESASLVADDDFVVHGATGGVGSATLDVARALHLRAIGLTRAPKVELFGARMVDSTTPRLAAAIRSYAPDGVPAVFDSRAGRSLWASRAMLRRDGRLVVFGLSAVANRGLRSALGTVGTLGSLALFRLLPGRRTTMFAMDRTFHRDPARVRSWVATAMSMAGAGRVAPVVGARFPLAEVSRAVDLVESGGVVGKVVVDCR